MDNVCLKVSEPRNNSLRYKSNAKDSLEYFLEHLKTLVLPSIWLRLLCIIIRGHGASTLEVRRGLWPRGDPGGEGGADHASWCHAPGLDGGQVRVGQGVGAETCQAVAVGLHWDLQIEVMSILDSKQPPKNQASVAIYDLFSVNLYFFGVGLILIRKVKGVSGEHIMEDV